MELRPCGPKDISELVLEWDQLAEERHRLIESGDDLSFDHILVPMALRLLEGADTSLVLDIGSGSGDFTARLARVAKRVIGIEPSSVSVAVARAACRNESNVRFVQASMESAPGLLAGQIPTSAVAAMTLMTTPNLQSFAAALSSLLPKDAILVATLTHPWFWPSYWGYDAAPWFNYARETFIEAPFAISRLRTTARTTHVHRPLEQYVSVFGSAGFRLMDLIEPLPTAEIQALYPRPWQYPRFIGLKWVKVV